MWHPFFTQTSGSHAPKPKPVIDIHDGFRKQEVDEFRKKKEELRRTIEQAFESPIAQEIAEIISPYTEPEKTSGKKYEYNLTALAEDDGRVKALLKRWSEYQEEEEAVINLLLL